MIPTTTSTAYLMFRTYACNPVCVAVDAHGRPRADLNNDCDLNALDIQPLIDQLMCQ